MTYYLNASNIFPSSREKQTRLKSLLLQEGHCHLTAHLLTSYGVFIPEQDNDKTNVEPVHSYDAFHTRSDMSGVKGIIGIHRFNFCLVLSLSCSGVKTPLVFKVRHSITTTCPNSGTIYYYHSQAGPSALESSFVIIQLILY